MAGNNALSLLVLYLVQEAAKMTNKQLVIICGTAVVVAAMAFGYSSEQITAIIRVIALCLGVVF